LEKEYAKLKRTSSSLVTSDFYQWSLQLLFKVVDVFFSFRVPGMNRMVPSEESQTYMLFKKISDCFNDIGRLLTCLEILNG